MSVDKHNEEIQRNKAIWGRKALLRRVYASFYTGIASRLRRGSSGLTVELGSGIGAAREFIPGCVTTDIFPNPWLDRVENAYRLRFDSGSVANLILFDVWHHLEFPAAALKEFDRVLECGGRVIIFEPAMGLFGRFIYGTFHHEPLALETGIRWDVTDVPEPEKLDYYAAAGNCWRTFRKKTEPGFPSGWRVVETACYPALVYICSGGFSGPQVVPSSFFLPLTGIEKLLHPFPSLFATRMLVALEREPSDDRTSSANPSPQP